MKSVDVKLSRFAREVGAEEFHAHVSFRMANGTAIMAAHGGDPARSFVAHPLLAATVPSPLAVLRRGRAFAIVLSFRGLLHSFLRAVHHIDAFLQSVEGFVFFHALAHEHTTDAIHVH